MTSSDGSPIAVTARTQYPGPGSVFYFERLQALTVSCWSGFRSQISGSERPARTEREKERTAKSYSCRGERRAGQQEPGRKREVERDILRDAEREQHTGRRPHAGDGSAGRDGKYRRRGAHAQDEERGCRREADAEGTQQEGAAESARNPAAEKEQARDERPPREARTFRNAPVYRVEAVGASDEREP